MRFFLGLLVALGFIVGGAIPLAGGFSMISRSISGDEVMAAFFIAGMLELIGVGILIAVFKSRKRRAGIDAAALSGTITGMALGSDPDYSDDFGDFGD